MLIETMDIFFWNLRVFFFGLVSRLRGQNQPVLVVIANSPPATGKSTLLAPEGPVLRAMREAFWSLNFVSLDNEVFSLTPQQRHLYSVATGFPYDSPEQRKIINLPGAVQFHLAAKSVADQAALTWPTVVVVQVPTQNLAPSNNFCLGDKLKGDYEPHALRFFHFLLGDHEDLDVIVQGRMQNRASNEHQVYIDSTKLHEGWYASQANTIRASASWDKNDPVELSPMAEVSEVAQTIYVSLKHIVLNWR